MRPSFCFPLHVLGRRRSSPSLAPLLVATVLTSGCTTNAPRSPTSLPPPVGDAASQPRQSTSADPVSVERLQATRSRLDALALEVATFWKTHGLDAEYGGFHGMHDRNGQPVLGAEKGLIQQSRHLWTFSTWYERREPTPEIRALADDVYRFLITHYLDDDHEFFFKVDRAGTQVVETKKQLYAESFAIFGLATYARIFDVPEARALALACFRSIDRRSHDGQYGGYDQTHDPGWLTAGASKETNTHIHLLEAFTALHRLDPDPLVRTRLQEMVDVTAHRLAQPSGYAHKEFYRDWRTFGPPRVSYGHDLETAWLIMDALTALDQAAPDVAASARRLGERSSTEGYDPRHGGYFEEGVPDGAPDRPEKVWWIQAEALPGLWWTYKLSGDPVHIDRLERTLDWIGSHQRNAETGEWYWGILPDGSIGERGDHMGEEWKASYHSLRALIFTSDWIAADLENGQAQP